MIDASGMVVYCNPAAERMFGYSADEMKAHRVRDVLVPAQYIERAVQGFVEFSKTGAGHVLGKVLELTALRNDGIEFPIEISVAVLRIKGRWCAAGIIRDITERKRAEAALRQEHRTSTPAARQRPRKATHRLRNPRRLGPAIGRSDNANPGVQLSERQDEDPKEAAKAYDATVTLLQQGHFEARRLITGVRPPILDEAGVAGSHFSPCP